MEAVVERGVDVLAWYGLVVEDYLQLDRFAGRPGALRSVDLRPRADAGGSRYARMGGGSGLKIPFDVGIFDGVG